jgi:hypothetical protein
MAKGSNRWNQGKPSLGDSFDDGFVSPWNAGARRGHGDYEDISTIPFATPPDTMAGQMDGDQNMTAGTKGKRGRK